MSFYKTFHKDKIFFYYSGVILIGMIIVLSYFHYKDQQSQSLQAKAAVKKINLIQNGNFIDKDGSIAQGWQKISDGVTTATYTLQRNGSQTHMQVIEHAAIGEGLSQFIPKSSSRFLVLTTKITINTGTVTISTATTKRILSSSDSSTTTTLIPPAQKDISVNLTAQNDNTSFVITGLELYELDMTQGNIPTDTAFTIPNQLDLKRSPSLQILQTIPTTLNISLQVVANHCDGSSAEKTINPVTNRCLYVERLALADLEQTGRRFSSVGKSFRFDHFDTPWDETVYQPLTTCPHFNGRFAGGQSMPPGFCNHIKTFQSINAPKLYIAVIYVPDTQTSGGSAYQKAAVYVAPSRARTETETSVDYWEKSHTDLDNTPVGTSIGTLTHEIGHLFGQIHTPWMAKEDNPVHGEGHELMYEGDLSQYYFSDFSKDKNIFNWVSELTKRSYFSEFAEDAVWNSIPREVNLRFNKANGEPVKSGQITFYSTSYNYPMYGGQLTELFSDGPFALKEDGSIQIPPTIIPEDGFTNRTALIYIIVKENEKEYSGWLPIMDLNLYYWSHNKSRQADIPINLSEDISTRRMYGHIQLPSKDNFIHHIYMRVDKKIGSESRYITDLILNKSVLNSRDVPYTILLPTAAGLYTIYAEAYSDESSNAIGNMKVASCSGKEEGNRCTSALPSEVNFTYTP